MMLLPSSSGCSAYAARPARRGRRPAARPRQRGPCRAAHRDHVLHRGRPGDVRVGDDRRDLAQGVVLLLGHPGVRRQDQVRLRGRDRLDVDAVGLVEQHRRLGAHLLELLLDPGRTPSSSSSPQLAALMPTGTTPSARGTSWLAQATAAIRSGFGLDRGLAVGVLDGHGEDVAGIRRRPRGCGRPSPTARRHLRRRRGSAGRRARPWRPRGAAGSCELQVKVGKAHLT